MGIEGGNNTHIESVGCNHSSADGVATDTHGYLHRLLAADFSSFDGVMKTPYGSLQTISLTYGASSSSAQSLFHALEGHNKFFLYNDPNQEMPSGDGIILATHEFAGLIAQHNQRSLPPKTEIHIIYNLVLRARNNDYRSVFEFFNTIKSGIPTYMEQSTGVLQTTDDVCFWTLEGEIAILKADASIEFRRPSNSGSSQEMASIRLFMPRYSHS